MPRSVAEIQAEIAKVKQEIATRDMYRQPQSRVGWASYVGNGDRGLLDAYQNREDQYNKMMKQQQFQAAEAALARKFQEAENERNRQNALKIASMNKSTALEDKRDEAKLRLEKLVIAKSEAERVGGDTRQLDAEIKYLTDKYGFEQSSSEPYDAKKKVEYHIAKNKEISANHNTIEEIQSAMDDIEGFDTPQAIELYVKLEKERIKRERMDKNGATLQAEIDAYNNKDGGLSTYLTNAGYKEIIVPGGYALVNPKGKIVKPVKSGKSPKSKWKP